MVAYSFRARFRAPILAGTQCQTIRADRTRQARPGEQVQLYTGMRTRQCRIIGRAVCTISSPVTIGVADGWVDDGCGRMTDPYFLDAFAHLDGFVGWTAMATFWQREHPDVALFSGVLIRWRELVQETPDA